jgi:hypothetical protein
MIFLFGTNAVSDLMRKYSKVEATHSQPTIESSCVRSFAVKIRYGTLSATGVIRDPNFQQIEGYRIEESAVQS